MFDYYLLGWRLVLGALLVPEVLRSGGVSPV